MILQSYLGKNENDISLNKYLISIGVDLAKADKKKFKSHVCYNIYDKGISLTFITESNSNKSLILDSFDLYKNIPNSMIQKRYTTVSETMLPGNLKLKTTSKELVENFGEPDEKGGGINNKYDIWLRWDKVKVDNITLGIQVEIDDRSWETAQNATWSSITIFKA